MNDREGTGQGMWLSMANETTRGDQRDRSPPQCRWGGGQGCRSPDRGSITPWKCGAEDQAGRQNRSPSEPKCDCLWSPAKLEVLIQETWESMLFFVEEREKCVQGDLLGSDKNSILVERHWHPIHGFFRKLRDDTFWQLRNVKEFSSSLLAQSCLPQCQPHTVWTRHESSLDFLLASPLSSQSVGWPPSKILP